MSTDTTQLNSTQLNPTQLPVGLSWVELCRVGRHALGLSWRSFGGLTAVVAMTSAACMRCELGYRIQRKRFANAGAAGYPGRKPSRGHKKTYLLLVTKSQYLCRSSEWNQLFNVQLKMAFAVIFHFVLSHFRCQKRSAITRSQQSY